MCSLFSKLRRVRLGELLRLTGALEWSFDFSSPAKSFISLLMNSNQPQRRSPKVPRQHASYVSAVFWRCHRGLIWLPVRSGWAQTLAPWGPNEVSERHCSSWANTILPAPILHLSVPAVPSNYLPSSDPNPKFSQQKLVFLCAFTPARVSGAG